MSYYLLWPASTGNSNNNKALLQISGISGVLSSIEYQVKTAAQPYTQNRYVFDIRRRLDTDAAGSGVGYILQSGSTQFNTDGTSTFTKNDSAFVGKQLFFESYAANDVFKFNVNATPNEGCIAIGARHNAVEHNYGFSISVMTIVDAAGSHTIDMTSSGGTLSEFSSLDGALTVKLFNFPLDNSQWVEYGVPTSAPSNIGGTLSNGAAAINWDAVADTDDYQVQFRRRV